MHHMLPRVIDNQRRSRRTLLGSMRRRGSVAAMEGTDGEAASGLGCWGWGLALSKVRPGESSAPCHA